MKESGIKQWWALFWVFFKINLFTFGGGYTIVPVIRDEFVRRKGWIEEEEMLDLVALAQSGPGPMAINASLLTGYRVAGPFGAIISLIASVLPCLIVISALFYGYERVSKNPWALAAFGVMAGAISAVLIGTTFSLAKSALKKHPIFGAVMMTSAFIASKVFHINTALIVLISALIGLILFAVVDESKVR